MSTAALSTLANLTQSYRLYGVYNAWHRLERINLLKASLALAGGFLITRLKPDAILLRARFEGLRDTDCLGREWVGAQEIKSFGYSACR